jgi:hypothetical protein
MPRRTSTVLPSIENHHLPSVENHPPTPYDTPSPQELFEERQDQHQRHQQHQQHHLTTSQNSEGIQVSANGNTQATSNAHGYGVFHQVVRAAFQKNPQMLPADPTEIINSNLIDRFTHALWGMICFGNIPLHEQAAKYGAMIGEPMIRALALLNILPSWWFLRERVLEWLRGSTPRIIDDSEMAAWQRRLSRQGRRRDNRVRVVVKLSPWLWILVNLVEAAMGVRSGITTPGGVIGDVVRTFRLLVWRSRWNEQLTAFTAHYTM